MQEINTLVVRALMHLRGVDDASLANLVHATHTDMSAWLNQEGEDSEARIPFDTQLEVLQMLGISNGMPRSDVVHYWRIHEPLFSRPSTTYWALATILKAFGKAQAVYIARDADPALSFKAKAHFALRFQGFMAILEITAHPLRTISFDPDNMVDVSWVPDAVGILLPAPDYARLEPGAMKVRGMQQHLTYVSEVKQWDRLRDAAITHGVRAAEVASIMSSPELSALAHNPSAPLQMAASFTRETAAAAAAAEAHHRSKASVVREVADEERSDDFEPESVVREAPASKRTRTPAPAPDPVPEAPKPSATITELRSANAPASAPRWGRTEGEDSVSPSTVSLFRQPVRRHGSKN